VLGFGRTDVRVGADWVSEGTGRVETRLVLPELALVAGVQMLEGQLSQTSYVRLTRDQQVLWSGRLRGLRRFTRSVRQVDSGQECAVSFEGFHGFEPGDLIEAFHLGPRQ
jgi:translation initiation factor IF-2